MLTGSARPGGGAGQAGEAATLLERLAGVAGRGGAAERGEDGAEEGSLLADLGRLWVAGAAVDIRSLWAGETRRRMRLPTYPFERRRYWIEPGEAEPGPIAPSEAAALDSAAPEAERAETASRPPRAAAGSDGPAAPPGADRSAPESLPLHARPELATPYVAPEAGLEADLARVWQRVLGVDRVGACDNFFDLGGDSFVASRLIEQLAGELGRVVPVVSVYEGLTVRSLARLLAAEDGAPAAAERVRDLEQARGRRREVRGLRRGLAVAAELLRDGEGAEP